MVSCGTPFRRPHRAGMSAGPHHTCVTPPSRPTIGRQSAGVSSRTVACDPRAAVPPQEERNSSHACSLFAGPFHLRNPGTNLRLPPPPFLSWLLRAAVLRALLRHLLWLHAGANPDAAPGDTDADRSGADCPSLIRMNLTGLGRSVPGENTGAGDRPRTDRSRDCNQPGMMPALSRLS